MSRGLQALLREAAEQRQAVDAVLTEAEAAGQLAPIEPGLPPPPAQAVGPQEVSIVRRPGESTADALARAGTSPFVPAAATVCYFMAKGAMAGAVAPMGAVIDQLEKQAQAASNGDLTHAEAVLAVQATTLDAVFNALARKAAANLDRHPDASERFLRMALKAQGQCRSTLETLAAIKQGPMVFAKQANINNGGQQQVNNGGVASAPATASRTRARGKRTRNESNELMEGSGRGKRLDT